MAAPDDKDQGPSRRFPATSWTMVSSAGRHSSGSGDSLDKLCTLYWFPIYAFIRRRGHSREEAEDLTQDFFARVLQHDTFAEARRERGRFRSFLLASVTHFLANEWDRSRAQKRGGGHAPLSLDSEAGETRYDREPFHALTPEALFERQWALVLLDTVLMRLRQEHLDRGRVVHFDRLKQFLTGDRDRGAYNQAASDLAMSPPAVKTAVHRLRTRYGELVREQVAATVTGPSEVESEIRFLLNALGRE